MPSAFVSYAHEDQEFMLTLVERLTAQGLDIRYDQVALNVGDSLIQKISDEIAQGDFLIAVISPDSVVSGWCQHELALAMAQGINQRRVKVLPVRFRDAPVPLFLQGTYWLDANQDDIETLARRLATAMTATIEGREGDADREAGEVQSEGGEPAHAEVAGDLNVQRIDEVADRLWDVLGAWAGVWRGGNVADLDDPQRRLRWACDSLPERVGASLPLVRLVADSNWGEFFERAEIDEVERDLRQELLAAKTRVAQGLPIVGRWMVVQDFGEVSAGSRDATAYLWELQRGNETERVTVYIAGTVMAIDDRHLATDVRAARNTRGRSALSSLVGLDHPPREVMVTTAGVSVAPN